MPQVRRLRWAMSEVRSQAATGPGGAAHDTTGLATGVAEPSGLDHSGSSVAADSVTGGGASRHGAAQPGSGGWRAPLGRGVQATNQYMGVLAVLALLLVALTVTQPQFLTSDNFVNILEANSVLLVVSVGLTFVLLVGGIDLSIVGTIALTQVGLWELIKAGMPAGLACVVVIAGAFAVGFLINGLLIGRVGLSFLVVTIATASIFQGVANVRTGGQSQSLATENWLIDVGTQSWWGLPVVVWIAFAVLLLGIALLRYTGYGRMVYAVGGNPEAARLAGINVALIRVSVFGICAGLAGLAAVLSVCQLTSATPNPPATTTLTAGAAVLLGGTSFMGGRGSLLGTLLGVLFLGVLSNGLTLAGISDFWTGIVSGTVLVAAILFDRLRNGAA